MTALAIGLKSFTWSDSEGTLHHRWIATGGYYVEFQNRQGYIDEWYQDANPFYGDPPPVHVDAPNKTSSIDFSLVLGGTVTGRVTRDPTGDPLTDIEVRLNDRNFVVSSHSLDRFSRKLQYR